MARLTGLFRRGSTYYMRVVLPIGHPARSERPSGRIVVSLDTPAYRDALVKGVTKRAEILAGFTVEPPEARPIKPTAKRSHEAVLGLRDVHQRWQAAHATSDDSSRACLRAVTLFENCVGDVPLDQIDRRMGDTFRAWLQQQQTSSKTARDRLVWVKSLLNYAAVDLELITRNPWRGLEIHARTESPRQPWTDESLRLLFNYRIWTERFVPQDRKAGGAAAYWLPLLGLYTGARCSELCQLRKDDIQQDGGVWFIRVTDSGQGQRVKSRAGHRIIPVHGELVRLGFLSYWKRVQTDSLWPALPKREGKAGGYFSQYFSSLRSELGLPAAVTFHSFRHTARTNLVLAGVAEALIDRLLGHEGAGGVGAKVYTHLSVASLQAAINLLPASTSTVMSTQH